MPKNIGNPRNRLSGLQFSICAFCWIGFPHLVSSGRYLVVGYPGALIMRLMSTYYVCAELVGELVRIARYYFRDRGRNSLFRARSFRTIHLSGETFALNNNKGHTIAHSITAEPRNSPLTSWNACPYHAYRYYRFPTHSQWLAAHRGNIPCRFAGSWIHSFRN